MNNVNGQVLIMLAPNESAYQQISNIPPLALGVLKGYLTEKGIRTEIYDLNVTLSKCASKLPLTIWSFVYDSQRVMSYLKGESDQEIDNALSRLVSGIDFTVYDLIGISMGVDFSWLEMHGGMLLAKWIHDKYKVPVEIGGNNVHYLLQFKNDFAELLDALFDVDLYICVGPGERLLVSTNYISTSMIRAALRGIPVALLGNSFLKRPGEFRSLIGHKKLDRLGILVLSIHFVCFQ